MENGLASQLSQGVAICFAVLICILPAKGDDAPELSTAELAKVRKFETQRIEAVNKVIDSVIAIYGAKRQGGGSGIIIDPSGIALTNHHVIQGAGVNGWGGLADGQLYEWELIGTDPGGDVAVIQMKGKDRFPFTPLGNSDLVRVGDWALAMGNPFVLTEDQVPTVTLGIVSGVKRYQWGAGMNQLVYGNCIQTDSSINPGNSGGPLFNLDGQVIGINGRGSFKQRGRVNVGLGYAISSNQIKNFIPELLATKLVEHGTLDANFEDRNGKVVCSNVYEDANLYKHGVRPGDELLEFEGIAIESAHQFTNLICTLPEGWPASLKIRKSDGKELAIHTRLYGLPYQKPQRPPVPENEQDQTPEQQEQLKRMQEMIDLLSAPPGTVRKPEVNKRYVEFLIRQWNERAEPTDDDENLWLIIDKVYKNGNYVGTQQIVITTGGQFEVETNIQGERTNVYWSGSELKDLQNQKELSLVESKLDRGAVQALGIIAANNFGQVKHLGQPVLDGSDKAQNRQSYRLKLMDAKDDPFFFWLSMYDKNGSNHIELLKSGADLNCKQDGGGIAFIDWVTEQGLTYPKHRQTIVGLSETPGLSFKTISCRMATADLPLNAPKTSRDKDAEPEEPADVNPIENSKTNTQDGNG